jgi:hypothetical protein
MLTHLQSRKKSWNGKDNLDIKKSGDDSSSLLSDDSTLSSLKSTSSNNINEDATGLVNSSNEDNKQDGDDGPKMNLGKAKLNKKRKADGKPKKTAAGGSKTGNSSTLPKGASKKDTCTLKERIDTLARKRAKTALSLLGANDGREPSRKISKESGGGMNKGKGISTSGNKVSTEVKNTTAAIRGKPLYTKRPVERNVSRDDHYGEKLARETRMTNTTEDATTEMKTTTSKTNAIRSKNKPVNRITDIASKPTKKRRTTKTDSVLHNDTRAYTSSSGIPKALDIVWKDTYDRGSPATTVKVRKPGNWYTFQNYLYLAYIAHL